jgi:anti-sigma B factor antagonist
MAHGMRQMQIEERVVGDVTILVLSGRLVLDEGEIPLRQRVDRLVGEGRIKIVLDMRGVTRIDSAGIGMIVSTFLTTFRHQGRLKLLHLTDRGGHLMYVTKLSTVFEIFDSEEAALRSFEP